MSNTNLNHVNSLAGKVAFVQGGSRGIGAAIVERLACEGANVAFTYVSSAEKAKAIVTTIEAAGGRALSIQADSGDAKALTTAIDQTPSTLARSISSSTMQVCW